MCHNKYIVYSSSCYIIYSVDGVIQLSEDYYKKKLRSLIKDLVRLQGECFVPMKDMEDVTTDLEELIEEYKI